ncbi:MAG TPA: tRNA (adenosine(37)-N6)-threonylcarbamoyltransferase complex ATPase subunit type 1 TsaE [Patescibacteria group bacterium]|nr:tRNA (adenosine(37)-N6)-threonylcarbamoyltransferase complex ATPase subunit type 1 TsaE [Patescibacteria group bacterium]
MEVISKSTGDTKKLAGKIAEKIRPGAVLALYGDLGSGKTTFVSYLVEALGLNARVQSPTFVMVRKYTGGRETPVVNHIDLYRLTSKEEVEEIGVPELISESNTVTVIEWPELAEHLLPDDTVKIKFAYIDENTRKINVQNQN